jgi:putative phosphoesterase
LARIPQLRKNGVLPLHSDGTLRLAAVADTHSTPHRELHRQLRAQRPDAILHAGDIGDLYVLEELARVAPVHAVRGNIDGRAPNVPDVLNLELVSGSASVLRILLTHIALNGPRLRADVARLARSERASLVVCGHSHVPFIGKEGGLSVFNPGSAGPRRFQLPILFGMITIAASRVELAHFDCESGERWFPPELPSAISSGNRKFS